MLQAAESLSPIILLIFLGAVLLKKRFISEVVREGLDRFAYWIALPSLFIHQLAATDFEELVVGGLIVVLILGVFITALLAAVLAKFGRLSKDVFGVFVQASFRGNLAFVGLPLIIFSLGPADRVTALVAMTMVALAALVPLANALSVLALVISQYGFSIVLIPQLVRKLVTNPLIISAFIGGLLGGMGWRLPVVVDRPLALLGQTALALALISLGAVLASLDFRGRIKLALGASAVKVVLMPALTYGLCVMFGLPAEQTFIAMILAACPAAAASYTMAAQLEGDHGLAATCVLVSTILSLAPLTLILILL